MGLMLLVLNAVCSAMNFFVGNYGLALFSAVVATLVFSTLTND